MVSGIRLAHALFGAVLATGVLAAQPEGFHAQEVERARRLIQSWNWVEKSWGVYWAGRLHSEDLEEPLIEQFRSAAVLRDSPPYSEEHAFVAVLFDAAIEANILVPPVLLEPFTEKWLAPVLVLLARDQNSEALLLSLRDQRSRDLAWLAVNNLLFARKSQNWYHALLEEIAITHRFTVVDSGFGGVGGGEGGGLCGDGVAVMPKGFPPVALYTLQAAAYPGRVMLAEGPQNVYYERTIVPTNKQVGIGSCTPSYNRMSIRIAYLARLASERDDDVKRLLQSETSIRYSGLEDLQHQIEQALHVQEDGIRALIRAIEKSGLPASNTRLRIVPELDDKRQQRIDSLPNVPPREFGLY